LGDDRIEMVQTSFSDSVPELIKTHLEEQGSIPAFLSALTLDLFSRQTFTS
jgi:mitotic spindle assembly checkpoint protein MAD1